MHCLLAALLSAASPSYVLFSHGRVVDPAKLPQPSGVRGLATRADGLIRADIAHQAHFAAWLAKEGIAAVREDGETQAMPVVLARGPLAVLQRHGRVEATANPGVYAVHLGAGVIDPHAHARSLASEPGVLWAEPDLWGRFETRAFNDPLYPNQWHLHASMMSEVTPGTDIRADQAWLYTRGSGTQGRVIVAVLDDGFSLSHPDMIDQWLPDGAGGVLAKDFVDGDNDPSAQAGDGHGTRVLGAAAARGNNLIGVSGVCPECNALPVRIFTSGKTFNAGALYGPMSVAADAMIWAADHGARVLNNSWGPIVPSTAPTYQAMPQVVTDAITNIVRRGTPAGSAGVLITWAAGNNPRQVASFDGWVSDGRVLSVGAINATGKLANYSEIGPSVRLLAPSSESGSQLPAIYTTDGAEGYSSTFGGTSAAAPIVAGAAALVLAKHPELSLAQLFEVLLDSAHKITPAIASYGRDGKSCTHGFGEVDALQAIELADMRATQYASGNSLHFELCGDGIDNDANPATTDTCTPCVPTSDHDTVDGVDNDCDGYIDNPAACVPNGLLRCAVCSADSDCAQDFKCLDRGDDGKRCLRTCDLVIHCGYDEACVAMVCLPQKAGTTLECGPYLKCTKTNGGVEACDDVDNDCNGQVDDIAPTSQEALSQTSAFRRAKFGVCATVVAECKGGRWVPSDPPGHVQEEIDLCDDLDNDCDGVVDEGCPPKPKPSSAPTTGCAAAGDPLPWLLVLALFRRRK